MRKMVLAVVAVLAAPRAHAQEPDFASFDRRIASLEQRLSAVEALFTPKTHTDGKRDYASAYQLALATGRPLVVSHGAAVCVACIHDTANEFVHFVGSVPGCPADSITVAVPENGDLVSVGVVSAWETGSPVWGHIPSVRRILQRFRANRTVTIQNTTASATAYQPTVMQGAAFMTSGGACATCGSSGRAGLFGRR